MRNCAKLLFILTFAAAMVATASAQPTRLTLNVAGFKREAIVYSPSASTNSGKSPVVFGFHGHGGNMQAAANAMHIQTLWPEAIVVYMQGLPTAGLVDPQGLHPGWQVQSGQEGDRDLKFFDAVLSSLHQRYSVDDSRIYVTGFSNGAIFSYLLWSVRGNTIAAIGAVAGRLFPSVQPTQARPLIHIGGRNDRVVSFEYQEQTIALARQIDGATGPGNQCGPICTFYPSTKGTPVATVIHQGGHIYPPFAPGLIVRFFKQHSLP